MSRSKLSVQVATFCLLSLAVAAMAQPVSLTPTTLTFPSRIVTTTSGPQKVTLTNNQTSALTISSVVTSGDFAETTTCPLSPQTLAAGATCAINVTFTPTNVGTRNGILTVTDNASPNTQTASLTGTGNLTGMTWIQITPASITTPSPAQTQLVATGGGWADLLTVTITNVVSWASSAPGVAQVNSTGLVQSIAAGTSKVSGTFGSVGGTATITVTGPQLTSISVTPTNPSSAPGGYQQFGAVLHYSDGSTKDATTTVSWSSSANSVATINSSGLATAVASGTTTISATEGSVTGSTSMTVSSRQCTSAPTGLVGWWSGDGDVVDLAANNSGTLQNGATFATGEVGSAFSFGGNGASVLVNANVYSPSAGTLMFWFLPNGAGALTGSIAGSAYRAPGFSMDSLGNLVWEFGDLYGQSIGKINPNQWHHAALTYAASGSDVAVNVYLDGDPVANAITIPNQSWYPQVSFGSYLGASASSFVGEMDEIAIFNQTLTQQQIQQVYGAFSGGMCKPTLQTISLNPASPPLLAPGAQLQFTASGTYSNGSTHDLTSSASWTSSNPAAATITTAGLATGIAPGSTTIKAALHAHSGSAPLEVGPSLVSIKVTPIAPTIAVGTTQQFTATGTYSDGTQQNITTSATWSSNSSSATITANGVATGITPGQAVITANLGSISNSASLTISSATLTSLAVYRAKPKIAAGTTLQFTGTGTFSDGSKQNLTTLATWSSSNPSVVSVNASGLGTGLSTGESTIKASFRSLSNSATLTVTSAVLTSIAVTPANQSLLVKGTLQFTATGTFSDDSQQDITKLVTWSSSNQTAVTINGTGLATALSQGATTIGATLNAISGTTGLTVVPTPPVLVSIAVTPASASLAVGLDLSFTAMGTYSDHSVVNITSSVQWSSSNPAVVTISNSAGTNGLATGVADGSSTITASLQSVSGNTGIKVTNAILDSIAITPASATGPVGGTTQFTATGFFTDGTSSNLTTTVTWSSSSPNVATVSNATGTQGLASDLGSGVTTISASSGAIGDSTTLAVQDQLLSITVTPSTTTVAPGTNQQFTATGTYLSGLTADLTDSVQWSSGSSKVATINGTGLAMSQGVGQTTITASAGSITNSAAFAVTAIQHVIIIMQENRSPDNLFHGLPGADIASYGVNSYGQLIPLQPVPLANTWDLKHSHIAFSTMYDNGKMDGDNLNLVGCGTHCPPPPNPQYGYVQQSDIAPYFQMAGQYTFADRMFQTNQGPSFPAHQFIISGTSAPTATSDLFASGEPYPQNEAAGCSAPSNVMVQLIDPYGNNTQTQYPCFEHQTIMDNLDDAGISWKYYSPSAGSIWNGPNAIHHLRYGPDWAKNVIMPNSVVLTDIAQGKLAAVSWVMPTGQESDHPAINDGSGPSWVSSIVNAVGNSPYWENTAIFITWDDWGGWYDHVAPPMLNSYEYGFRVPLVVVSPYAKPAYVSHVMYDFGSILKMVEQTFSLPSLGYADSFANDLSDCFNFNQSPITFKQINAPLGPEHFINDKSEPLDPDDD
ncbi:MAG: Ig-like domain-containing protein [Candidatus Sulfotelmatobacter sp.]